MSCKDISAGDMEGILSPPCAEGRSSEQAFDRMNRYQNINDIQIFCAQNLILVNFFGFFVKCFFHVLEVSGLCRGPGRVGTGPGDVFTRVLTNFHRKRAAGDRVMRLKLFKLTSNKLTSIKFRA